MCARVVVHRGSAHGEKVCMGEDAQGEGVQRGRCTGGRCVVEGAHEGCCAWRVVHMGWCTLNLLMHWGDVHCRGCTRSVCCMGVCLAAVRGQALHRICVAQGGGCCTGAVAQEGVAQGLD